MDLDECIESGNLSEKAKSLIERFDSVTETSISGEGIHIFVKAKAPDSRTKIDGVELLSNKFIAITGELHPGRYTVENRQDEMDAFFAQHPIASASSSGGLCGQGDPQKLLQQLIRIMNSSCYNVDDYQDWLDCGMVLKHEFPGNNAAKASWVAWSSQSKKYKPGEPERKWESFRRSAGENVKTAASMLKRAEENGFAFVDWHEEFKNITFVRGGDFHAHALWQENNYSGSVSDYPSSLVAGEGLVNVSDYLNSNPDEVEPIIEGLVEPGDILSLIGKAKARKTFLLLQVLLCLAAAKSFLGLSVRRAFRVLHVQLEVKPNHFHKRVKLVASALSVRPEDIENRFHVLNLRGIPFDWEQVRQEAIGCGAEVIALDPAYKILEGEENNDKAWRDFLLETDRLARTTGASVWIVHHDKKGGISEDNVDRGSGRNILARHFDAAIYLSPQAGNPSATIFDFESRNFKAPDSFVAKWSRGAFSKIDGAIPSKRTNNRQRLNTTDTPLEEFTDPALGIVADGLYAPKELKDLLRQRLNLSRDRSDALYSTLVRSESLTKLPGARRLGIPDVVGKPEQIEQERERRELLRAIDADS
ncbi:MAG: AAA family ATPase [Bdellovibrionales bacterium]|nr:AAA family ATPase [Bdellovibrionales bacterium]